MGRVIVTSPINHKKPLTEKFSEMKSYTFIVERTETGYSAYAKDDGINAITVGSTIKEIKLNALESLNLLFEHNGKKPVGPENIIIQLDIPQFFEYYKVINAKAFSERVGINTQLLNQYIKGSKVPSEKQVAKIASGLREVGKELMELDYA